MANHEVQLCEVSDTDRFQIIDLYRQNPTLWCREKREKGSTAWIRIAKTLSAEDRVFSVPLVQKIVKNLVDQYRRLLRRGSRSNWKFQDALEFLGTKSTVSRILNKPDIKIKSAGLKTSKKRNPTTAVSFVKVDHKPTEQLIRSICESPNNGFTSKLKAGQVVPRELLSSSSTSQSSSTSRSSSKPTSSRAEEDANNFVKLNEVTDIDRMKIIKLYEQQPVLWNKNSNGQRDRITKAWQFIIDGASSPGHRFDLPMVQKISKNFRDQYFRIKKRGGERSNWKYLDSLRFLDSCPTANSRRSIHESRKHEELSSKAHETSESFQSSSPNAEKALARTSLSSPAIKSEVQLESVLGNDMQQSSLLQANLTILSLAMPLMTGNLQSSLAQAVQTAPLARENFAAIQAELCRAYPGQCKNSDNSQEAMIAAWPLIVEAYMNAGR